MPIPTLILRTPGLVNSARELLSAWRRRSCLRSVAMLLDENMERIVCIFQKEFHLGYVERDPVKYVKRYPGEIDWAGHLFKYLGLAELDKQSPLGWRPTP